jgi:myo-inositol 2-dehydrogenase/D-chiro-inositol 1-dehydrogenase
MTKRSRVNIGVIGVGRIGRLHTSHLASLIPQAKVVALADVWLEAAELCASEFGIDQAVEDHRVIMDNPDIEAVVVCSSTDTHSRMIEEAAEAGKHIFCEKPVDFDLARIDRALSAVEKAGVKLQIGFNRRFDPNFRRVREAILEGKIGDLHILRITSRDPEPPPLEYVKVSGGIFLDMTIHDFDMARYLSGSEVEEVYTAGAVMVDPAIGEAGDLDTAIITLKFENGVLGTIDNSRRAVYGYDQRVEAFGSAGMVDVSNNRPTTAKLSTADCVQEDLPLFFFMERYTESYIAEMREFIRCILEDRIPPVSGIDGRIPVVIGKAARLSYDENRPVKLSEIVCP